MRGDSTLLLAPTGSGKTLAAFLAQIDRLMFSPVPEPRARCRVVYVSPLKALAVDIERNLRVPLAGISAVARESGAMHHEVRVALRTGDTPPSERARFARRPPDILVTTPESLYLLLTSQAREALRHVETVIVDEIHAMVASKRGAHLAVSLERLEVLAAQAKRGRGRRPLQRIGLSATQRPLDEVARFLGGFEDTSAEKHRARSNASRKKGRAVRGLEDALSSLDDAALREARNPRPVTIVDSGARKPLSLRVEVPLEDMTMLDSPFEPAPSQKATRPSMWQAIHPRLVELIRAHRTTLVFVNARRTAERLAAALNDLTGESLVQAHHGSIARAQRAATEDALKRGVLRAIVATSSLELGIDMGSIDLVIQVECPPSVASGLQRVGRSGHQVGAISAGVLLPKYRGDLLACAAVARAMVEGAVEATHAPLNPLDVLAQQIVAMSAMDRWDVDAMYTLVRRSAPFARLPRAVFDGVLDMLAGKYPADDFAELRPRVTWDRARGTVAAREGARRVAVTSGGTIPDRGLFGVFLAGAEPGKGRVGELDEEMVFESAIGDTVVLGASSWRVEDITHDRVVVSPAPGAPGRTPFWKGDRPSRPAELGRRIGALVRDLCAETPDDAIARLRSEYGLDEWAARNLVRYLEDQRAATRVVPDDRTVLVERCRDDLGEWRVCVLSPFGGRLHQPWAMAVSARIRAERGLAVETLSGDDGFVVRMPDTDAPPNVESFLLEPEELRGLVLEELMRSRIFASRFREAAARALLLPRRRPGRRTPLWQQRKRAFDLLSVASRFPSFPIVLEALRECVREVFDLDGLADVLGAIRAGRVQVVTVDSARPSPFAAALLFGYVASYLYDGDAPLAERRAQALTIDTEQLRAILGEVELRTLLDPGVIADVQASLQSLDEGHRAHGEDSLHDLLLRVGDLSVEEIALRCDGAFSEWVRRLEGARRIVPVSIAGERRFIAAEDAARVRDGLGAKLPRGLPDALLAPAVDASVDLVRRYARTHGPFTVTEVAARLGLSEEEALRVTRILLARGRLVEGSLSPRSSARELCDVDVLAIVRRRSLAKVRREIEPVDVPTYTRMLLEWSGVTRKRREESALAFAIERLQGARLAASVLERDLLPARVDGYRPEMLDAMIASGEVVWCGAESLGERDGRIQFFLASEARALHLGNPRRGDDELGELADRERAIVFWLESRGASFFEAIHEGTGGGYPRDTIDALWQLVWRGIVTNDSLYALRAFVSANARTGPRAGLGTARMLRSPLRGGTGGRSRVRGFVPPEAAGRWSLWASRIHGQPSTTEWAAAIAEQLLLRYGIVTREAATAEQIPGGFGAIYDVLSALEAAGRIRRGYFVGGLGAAQFALPEALDLLRSMRSKGASGDAVVVSATDPANPYGALCEWPRLRAPARVSGAYVVLVDGVAAGFLSRHGAEVQLHLPSDEPARARVMAAVAAGALQLAHRARSLRHPFLIEQIDGANAREHAAVAAFAQAGLRLSANGLSLPNDARGVLPAPV